MAVFITAFNTKTEEREIHAAGCSRLTLRHFENYVRGEAETAEVLMKNIQAQYSDEPVYKIAPCVKRKR